MSPGVYQNIMNDDMNVWAFESDENDFLLCSTPDEYHRVINS